MYRKKKTWLIILLSLDSASAQGITSLGDTLANTVTLGGFNTYLGSPANASLRLGQADASAPVAQTIGVQNVVAGTMNTAGVNTTIKGSAGTGTGAGGSIIFQTAAAGSTGSSQNAWATALTLDSTLQATFAGKGVFNGATNAATALFQNPTASTGKTSVLIKAGAGDTASDLLMDFQNNAGTSKWKVTRDGATTQAGNLFGVDSYFSNSVQIKTAAGFAMSSPSVGVVTFYENTAFTDFNRIQFGGTTSSFPALKRSSATLQVRLADDSADADFKVRHYIAGGAAPSIASGFGTSPSIAGTDAGGRVTIGTGGTATTGTVTFGTAWGTAPACTVNNETTQLVPFGTATTTTLVIASATPFAASDKLTWTCIGY